MPAVVTRRFRHHVSEQFYEAFSEAAATNMYLFIGRVLPWDNESSPDTPVDSIQSTDYDTWTSMLGAKKVTTSDVTYAVTRYDWTSGKVYREYNTNSSTLFDAPASSNTFYVMTDADNVYKCLYNNKGTQSTVKPTGTSTSTLVTADGYHWKYLYTIDAGSILKFVTANYIPVKTLTSDDGSAQWDVQAAASNGAIDIIHVQAGGNSYLSSTGTLSAVTNSTSLAIANTASGTDNIYNGSSLYISSGLGSGQVRTITDYNGTTKVVTLGTALSVTPNTSSTYSVGPTVTISGDGTGAQAYANVSSNSVNYVNMIATGSNYSQATVTISANSSHGSGANAIAYVSPPGGHGSDPKFELGGHNVILNVQLTGAESNTLPVTNDFRVFGVVKDPVLLANGAVANGASYDQTTRLSVTSVSGLGAYTLDETIRGDDSGATGRVVKFANTNAANTTGICHIVDSKANGTFTTAETLTGLTSGITAVLSSTTYGDFTPYLGNIIYKENTNAISRSPGQTEDIKLIVKF